MEDQKQTSFTFEIDNLSKREGVIRSSNFLSGDCEWYLQVYPKGNEFEDHLALYLCVANPESLRVGWKRRASFSFVLLNQSGKELYKTKELWCKLFCDQAPGWGKPKALHLKKLQNKGFVEKNELIVKVELKIVDESEVTGNETLDVKAFQVLYPRVDSVRELFRKHPDITANFKPKIQQVRTSYMNVLPGLIEALNKPPHSLSETELSNASSELIKLTEAGFKLDWLKTKLDGVSLERKKASADDSIRVRELEEQIKNLKAELNKEKEKSATSAAKVMSLEKTVSDIIEQNKKRKMSP